MERADRLDAVIKQSAFMITAVSVLLFFWGFLTEAFTLLLQGVPLTFLPERTIQEYMLTGGLAALVVFLPIAGLGLAADAICRGAIRRFIVRVYRNRPATSAVLYLCAVLFSIVLLASVQAILVQFNRPHMMKVKAVRLADDAKRLGKYEGLYFIAKKGKSYVFVDHPVSSIIRLLARPSMS